MNCSNNIRKDTFSLLMYVFTKLKAFFLAFFDFLIFCWFFFNKLVSPALLSSAADLLLIPLVIGVSSALFVGIVIIAAVTCCFMKRLARQRNRK